MVAVVVVVLVLLLLVLVSSRSRRRRQPPHFEGLLARAEARHAAGRAAEARKVLVQVVARIDKLPSTAELAELRGRAYLATGDIDRAAGSLSEAIASYRQAVLTIDVSDEVLTLVAHAYVDDADASSEAVDVFVRYVAARKEERVRAQETARGSPAPDADTPGAMAGAALPRAAAAPPKAADRVLEFLELRCRLTFDSDPGSAKPVLALAQRVEEADTSLTWAPESIGLAHALRGDLSSSIDALQRSVALAPDHPRPHYLLGRVEIRAGQREQGAASLRRSITLDGDQPDALFSLAQVLLAAAEQAGSAPAEALAETATLLDRACALRPDRGGYWLALGRPPELLRSHFTSARTALEKGTAILPDQVDGYAMLATARHRLGDHLAAMVSLRRVVELAPERTDSRLALAELALAQNRPEEAEAQYRAVLHQIDQHVQAQVGLGRSLYAQSRWQEAVASLSPVASSLAKVPRLELARAHAKAGSTSDAIAVYQSWLDEFGGDGVVFFHLGCAQGRLGQLEAALASFDVAEETISEDRLAELLRCRGEVSSRLDRTKDARTAFERATASDPEHFAGHYGLGVALVRSGDWLTAGPAFARAAELNRQHAPSWYGIGVVNEHLGQLDDARRAYETAVQCSSRSVMYAIRLSVATIRASSWKQGCEILGGIDPEAFHDVGDHDVTEARLYGGFALAQLGAYAEALDLWSRASTDDSSLSANSAVAHYFMGLDALRRNDYDAVVEHWSATIATKPDTPGLAQALADVYSQRAALLLVESPGSGAEACESVESALRLVPAHRAARALFGLALRASGDLEGAAKALSAALASDGDDHTSRYFLALTQTVRGVGGDPSAADRALQALSPLEAEMGPRLPIALAETAASRSRWHDAFDIYGRVLRMILGDRVPEAPPPAGSSDATPKEVEHVS